MPIGTFEKIKARLVAGGDGQDKTLYENLSSPTVSLEAVFSTLAIAAVERRKIATVDITGAYLEVELRVDDEVYMTLDPITARILSQMDTSSAPYISSYGTIIVKLVRALYGCVQSARLWYIKLRDALSSLGFEANVYDLCTFNKTIDGKQLSIAFHVDDLFITCVSEASIDNVISDLERLFAGVSATRGAIHSYLGMTITIGDEYYDLDMSGYLDKLLEGRDIKACPCPANDTLMEESKEAELLDAKAQKVFHSDVAKVLYIAKRVRQMVLPATSILASRVNKATVNDRDQLDRVFGYLLYSKDLVMRYKCGGDVTLSVYVDASWAVHSDCYGRTGIVVMMANCSVGCVDIQAETYY